jgi:hypothetical protein
VARRTFDRVAKAARKNELELRDDEGPGAFLDRVRDGVQVDDRSAVSRFKRIYLKARFASDSVSADELEALHEAARDVVAALKNS